MQPTSRLDFSWRADPAVPDFDESRLLVVLDGDCGLCSATARRIARLDRADSVRLCTAQSTLGQALLAHFDLRPDDPDSWLLITEGRALGGLDAAIHLFPALHRGFAPMVVLRLLPARARDWLYARIARNRYRLYGRADLCTLPDPAVHRRLVG